MHAACTDVGEASASPVERTEISAIRKIERRIGIGELRLLGQVVHVPSKLELRSFSNLKLLRKRNLGPAQPRRFKGVSSEGAGSERCRIRKCVEVEISILGT